MKSPDANYFTVIEWEGDKTKLEDFFDPDDEFMLFPNRFPKKGEIVPGTIAFHFTDRRIWIQLHDEELTTMGCTVDYAKRHDKELYADYDEVRRNYRRYQKKLEKNKLKGKLI